MPGAFTPNCTRVHLPQYVSHANDFYSAGVDQIIVMVANDACVVAAWADAAGCASAGIRVLSDRECAVAKVGTIATVQVLAATDYLLSSACYCAHLCVMYSEDGASA
jgi:peroxiredoxin